MHARDLEVDVLKAPSPLARLPSRVSHPIHRSTTPDPASIVTRALRLGRDERVKEPARPRARESRPCRFLRRIYLTGGSTAVLEGWREAMIDVDLRFEPEADELLRELPALKERLGVNIELSSLPDFIPELSGWRERSPLVFRDGGVDVHHFDLYSQVLSKIERSFAQDLADIHTMIERDLVEPARLLELYEATEPEPY